MKLDGLSVLFAVGALDSVSLCKFCVGRRSNTQALLHNECDEPVLQVGALKQLRETIQQFQHWYSLFDSDQSGVVEATELADFLASLGFIVSQEKLVEIAWQIDADGNGYIEFAEFVKVMTEMAGV